MVGIYFFRENIKNNEKTNKEKNMKIEEKHENVIEIMEDVRISNSDVILEKGDKIKVLQEGIDPDMYYYHATIDLDYNDKSKIDMYLRKTIGWDAYDEVERGPYITYSFTPNDWIKVKSFIEPLSDEVDKYSV